MSCTIQPIVSSPESETKSNSDLHLTRRIGSPLVSKKLISAPMPSYISVKSLVKPTSLTASLAKQPKTVSGVPIIVEACLRYLSANASDCELLFRTPGNPRLVDQLWEFMENFPYTRLSTNSISLFMLEHPEFTAHEVASFLKCFIDTITSGPVVTYICYGPFLELVKQKCPAHLIGSKFKCIVRQLLVPDHRALLGRLCNFLQELLGHEEQTRMATHAFAVCFGFLVRAPPEIGRRRNCMGRTRARSFRKMSKRQRMQYRMAQAKISLLNASIIEAMIRHAHQIFKTTISTTPRT